MKPTRLFLPPLLAATVAAALSCGDPSPVGVSVQTPAPGGVPQASLIDDIIKSFFGLVDSCSSLPTETVSKTIGREGGVIAIGPDTLRIPPNALTKPVTIQASLPAGYFVNVVVFKPDGLRFRKPASLTMGYSNCTLLHDWNLEIAEVTDDLEIIEYLQSTHDKRAKTVTGVVRHFTNYAVAW